MNSVHRPFDLRMWSTGAAVRHEVEQMTWVQIYKGVGSLRHRGRELLDGLRWYY